MKAETRIELDKIVRQLIKKHGNQANLARATGIKESTLSNFISFIHGNPRIRTIEKLGIEVSFRIKDDSPNS